MEQVEQLGAPKVSTTGLWMGILVAPLAWALDEGLSYVIDQHACSTGKYYLVHLITAVCFLLAMSGLLVSWRQLRRVPSGANEDGGSPRDRSWFMARLGILMSVGFALVILAMAVPKVILSPCD